MKGCHITSIPRTESHLFIDLLTSIGYDEISNQGTVFEALRNCAYPANKVMHGGHIPPTEAFFNLVKTTGFKPVVMTREPKDVVVSYAHFMQKNIWEAQNPSSNIPADKILHPPWKSFIGKSIEESIELLITGIDGELVSIVEWYRRFFLLPGDTTLAKYHIPVILYEDMILDPAKAIHNIGEYLDLRLSRAQIDGFSDVVGRKGSFFFWQGKIGSWKKYFTDKHNQLFREVWENG